MFHSLQTWQKTSSFYYIVAAQGMEGTKRTGEDTFNDVVGMMIK